MQIMENETTFFEPLVIKAEAYGKTSYELFRLKTTEKTADVFSSVISRSVAVFSLYIFIIFLSIGISLWLGELLGKVYYGFLCVAGFYAITCGVLYFFLHNWIKKFTSDLIIKKMLN